MPKPKGYKHSEIARKNIIAAIKRRTSLQWIEKTCIQCGERYSTTKGKERAKERRFCSKECAYKCPERAKQIQQRMLSAKNPNWKNGATEKNHTERMTAKYKNWRTAVFERDNYTCVECGEFGGKLNADHIKPFAHYPNERYELNNGRTLCEECHWKTDTYGHKANKKALAELT